MANVGIFSFIDSTTSVRGDNIVSTDVRTARSIGVHCGDSSASFAFCGSEVMKDVGDFFAQSESRRI